jgi:DNA uptake protein ComE-like DNA-binding protein
MEQQVIGVLYSYGSQDGKVRRWALNAVARVGRAITSADAITFTLQKFAGDPQTAASAIAALFALQPDEAYSHIKKEHDFPEDLLILSALQHAQHSALSGSNTKVNINTATVDVLKLALVAIGLNRAPEHIFDPRFENAEIVKDLGTHHDAIVSQYTVWAISENSMLGLKDLGIDLKNIEQQAPNVRAWMFRLIAAEEKDVAKNLEYVQLGSTDRDIEARAGLAQGLTEIFYEEIAPLILDWHGSEDDEDCCLRLLDHIVRQADRSPSYRERALTMYRADKTGERLRERMRANASGHELFGDFVRHDQAGGPTLFDFSQREGVTYVKNTINIGGNVTGSAIAQGGDASTSTDQSAFSADVVRQIQTELAKAQGDISQVEMDKKLKEELLAVLAKGAGQPTPENMSSVMKALKMVASAIGSGGKAAGIIAGVINALHALHVIT